LAAELRARWHIEPTTTRTGFMIAFRAVLQEYADEPFSLMRDVICGAVERLIVGSGHSVTDAEVIDIEQLMWAAAIPAATPADGAVETLRRLRGAGIRTGIISYADIAVFEALLAQAGLAGLTDVEVCSEVARSCKPHPEIFHLALRTVGVEPSGAMFVGDDVDTDIVGANRVGMRTALLSAREFTVGHGADEDRDTHPDHHIDSLLDVINIVIGTHPSQQCP
jgi:HAD superfamily hydrolase (TIGR01509 family)